MAPTSVSLLDRLKVTRPDASDWNRLQGIYLPLISRWLGRVPGLGDEAADLAQDVFVVVIRERGSRRASRLMVCAAARCRVHRRPCSRSRVSAHDA
ncbi:MAG: hypothetical protein ACHRXM_17575 [Isosphaerales bacterium]